MEDVKLLTIVGGCSSGTLEPERQQQLMQECLKGREEEIVIELQCIAFQELNGTTDQRIEK